MEKMGPVVDDLKAVNWSAVFYCLGEISTSLNGQQWRFLKGSIVSNAIDAHNGGVISYVNSDKDGHYFIHNGTGVRIKQRYQLGSLITPGYIRRDYLRGIRLSNHMGAGDVIKEFNFDAVCLVDSGDVAVIPKDIVLEYSVNIRDSVILRKIPSDKVYWLLPHPIKISGSIAVDLRESVVGMIKQVVKESGVRYVSSLPGRLHYGDARESTRFIS